VRISLCRPDKRVIYAVDKTTATRALPFAGVDCPFHGSSDCPVFSGPESVSVSELSYSK